MRDLGVRFGKGLQMTNILRDVDGDLRIGRCYLPRTRLEPLGIRVEDLHASADRSVVRPVIHELLAVTLEHYRAGWEYTLAIPRRVVSLRLACIWPLWIGLRTLELLAQADDPCAARIVRKIERPEVKRLMRRSALRAVSNRALDREYGRMERRVRERLQS
jgi:farnesyl-diphosphate farnesyltransferase